MKGAGWMSQLASGESSWGRLLDEQCSPIQYTAFLEVQAKDASSRD